jgi:hypothetical protein
MQTLYHLFTHFINNWDKYGVVILFIREIKVIEGIIKVIKPIYSFLYDAMNIDATVQWVYDSAKWAWGKIIGLFKKN